MDNATMLAVEVFLEEDADHTDARAFVRVRDRDFGGWGRARRNPTDPSVPMIGEELATARALYDLAHHLMEAAAAAIENYEGRPVDLHE